MACLFHSEIFSLIPNRISLGEVCDCELRYYPCLIKNIRLLINVNQNNCKCELTLGSNISNLLSAAHGCTRQFTRYLLDSERTGRQQGPDLSIGKGDPSHTPDFVFGVVRGLFQFYVWASIRSFLRCHNTYFLYWTPKELEGSKGQIYQSVKAIALTRPTLFLELFGVWSNFTFKLPYVLFCGVNIHTFYTGLRKNWKAARARSINR